MTARYFTGSAGRQDGKRRALALSASAFSRVFMKAGSSVHANAAWCFTARTSARGGSSLSPSSRILTFAQPHGFDRIYNPFDAVAHTASGFGYHCPNRLKNFQYVLSANFLRWKFAYFCERIGCPAIAVHAWYFSSLVCDRRCSRVRPL